MTTIDESAADPRILLRPSGPESIFHLDNLTIQEIFFHARNAYMAGLGLEDLWFQPVVPTLRELSISFERSVPTTTPLTCRTQVVERRSRSFIMKQVLTVTGTDMVVADCRAVQVTVSKNEPGAVAIPDELWAAIVALEGGHPPHR